MSKDINKTIEMLEIIQGGVCVDSWGEALTHAIKVLKRSEDIKKLVLDIVEGERSNKSYVGGDYYINKAKSEIIDAVKAKIEEVM